MITMVMVISTAVIIIDLILKSFAWEISKQLGPYVGLIITNCIIMGRAEGFAMSNPPLYSLLDAIGNSTGYMIVLIGVAFFRELLGSGTLFNVQVLPDSYVVNQVMILAPGAFIMLGIIAGVLTYKNMRRN
jgi:Na+-transporting NADH:ubiquinone oxidoreductase subunit D